MSVADNSPIVDNIRNIYFRLLQIEFEKYTQPLG